MSRGYHVTMNYDTRGNDNAMLPEFRSTVIRRGSWKEDAELDARVDRRSCGSNTVNLTAIIAR